MALWFSVFVIFWVQQVFARECPALAEIKNCNECIRCNGIWCNKPDSNGVQCGNSRDDEAFCPHDREKPLMLYDGASTSGSEVEPQYMNRSILIGQEDTFKLSFYRNTKTTALPKVSLNTTKSVSLSQLHKRVHDKTCENGKCTVTISVRPTSDFCPAEGSNDEFFELKVQIEGVTEEVTARYHVPCACNCALNAKVEADSPKCNGNGDYMGCGTCTCKEGWTGAYCETEKTVLRTNIRSRSREDCGGDRGDTPMECISNEMVCSNNGICSCGTCECFADTDVQYFGNYCEDICQYTANNCDSCILKPKAGHCNECPIFSMIIDNYNKTLLEQYEWTKCNLTENDVFIRYVVRLDVTDFRVMVITGINGEAIVAGNAINVTVPVILGVIAVIAAATVVAGYMIWKNKTPPVPLTDPKYENIDAEDCTGINPLYKPPTSSFKNPQYGNKW